MSDKIKSGIISIDKTAGMTSHDAVAILRRILHIRRIGHAGTLDEMATGVLPICFGRATRAVDYAQAEDKVYVAGLRFGITTDTLDVWGEVRTENSGSVSEEAFRKIIPEFTGAQKQIPPMYSAIKRGGKKLYELARAGVEIEREPRSIIIQNIELLSFDEARRECLMKVSCSKGTYIRSLCADMGERLGVGGAMCSLRRTVNGRFDAEHSFTLERVESLAREGRLSECVLPVDTLFDTYSRIIIDRENEKKLRHGADIRLNAQEERDMCRVYSEEGEFLALARIAQIKNGVWALRPIKTFFETGDKDSDE